MQEGKGVCSQNLPFFGVLNFLLFCACCIELFFDFKILLWACNFLHFQLFIFKRFFTFKCCLLFGLQNLFFLHFSNPKHSATFAQTLLPFAIALLPSYLRTRIAPGSRVDRKWWIGAFYSKWIGRECKFWFGTGRWMGKYVIDMLIYGLLRGLEMIRWRV